MTERLPRIDPDVIICFDHPRRSVLTGAHWNALCERLERLEANLTAVVKSEAAVQRHLAVLDSNLLPFDRDQRGWQIGDPQ